MINIENMNFGYNKSQLLFEALSLRIPKGGIYGLLGKNGVGKTTLLKILAGLRFPASGECRVLEAEPRKRQAEFLAELYLLPEDLYIPDMTGTEYCIVYAEFYPKFDHNLFQQVVKQFDISVEKLLPEMSHGQKKKFFIAFGIATQAKLFMMDEPTNGLDIPSKSLFRQMLATHFSEDRIFIISTHQVHDVQNLIDHVIMLDRGKIIFNQPTLEIGQRLTCARQTSEPKPHECLYYEKQIGGYLVMTENRGEESEIDLELLFNAILSNPTAFTKIFTGE